MNSSELECYLQQEASRGLCSAVYVLESRKTAAAGNRLLWIMLPSRSPCNFPRRSLKGRQHVAHSGALTENVIKVVFDVILDGCYITLLHFNWHEGNIGI